jgi:Na+/H+ antiporter NhaD/arsenite permease-like protein
MISDCFVVARALKPTGIFEYLGTLVLRRVRGDGSLLLLSIVVLTAPICAILPNATVVILFAPLLIQVCRKMEIDFAPPIMLLVFVANASGLRQAWLSSVLLFCFLRST